ncbi:hypothetical protein KBX50_05150 [Micromonospora sp. C51]|uniref:hypothetical protein n=1 Tax=Micromonospora sp. C51 TaxID=2824879 RepID=UPI001B39349A|nr:hypothetical protein [Micromonospora sp. C51]MBQ1047845.1 hypothetical protein [Micromonospora sp. C51]
MTIYAYGGGLADWAMTTATADGVSLLTQLVPGAVITCWTEQVGGDQITDLATEDGLPVTQVTVSAGDEVYAAGTIPRFRAPHTSMWLSADGGPRLHVTTSDWPAVLADVLATATTAQQAASAAASSAAELAAESAVPAHVEALDPHAVYLNTSRGDARYPLRRPGLMSPLAEPIEVLRFASTPPAEAADVRQVWVTHLGIERLVAWLNERGYPRAEQVPGALWDAPYTSIVNYAGTGRAFLVQRRGPDNSRVDIGGIDVSGRVVTSEQAWSAVTVIDPNATGNYTASTAVGPAPLQLRWEADDIVRMQGRLTCTAVTAGHVLMRIPDQFLPQSARLITLPTTTGAAVPCELLVNGDVVARATVSGPLDLSVDDVTYARVVAEQDTGGWTLDYAGSGTPGTTSPITVTHSGVADRLYLLVISRSTATDPYTTVTDSAGNSWTRQTYAPTSGSVGRRIEMWTCIPATPFATVSAAFTGAATAYASLYEITGHHPSTPIDQVASDFRSASTTPTAVQVTPSGAGRLVVSACQANNNTIAQMTPSAGWIVLGSHSGGPAVAYQVDPPAGSPLGVSWTFANSVGSGHAIAALQPE